MLMIFSRRTRGSHCVFPIQIPGLHMGLLMQREVSALLRRAPAEGDAYDAFTVHWEAVGGGPFPRFEGTVEVKGDEDYDSFLLVLSGSYDPPLGALGEAFDAVVGRWIAIATARDLLERIRETVEAAYRVQEAGKSHPVCSP
jgi:hypothetical protein